MADSVLDAGLSIDGMQPLHRVKGVPFFMDGVADAQAISGQDAHHCSGAAALVVGAAVSLRGFQDAEYPGIGER